MTRDPGDELDELPLEVRRVPPEELHSLRRRVLRLDDPTADVSDPRDYDEHALNLGGFIGDRLVVCASFYESVPPVYPKMSAYQLRYMATDFGFHRRGYGAAVLAFGEGALRARHVEQLWANARETAVDFYLAAGWSIIAGSEHDGPPPDFLPHRVIFKLLGPQK